MPDTPPTLRRAQPADLDTVLAFTRAYYEYDHLPFDDAVRPALARLLEDPAIGRVWLICAGDRPIGHAILCFCYDLEYRGRDAFVTEIFIEEAHRGRGAGAAVIAAIQAEAAALGVRAIHLEVMRDNERALALYRKCGFIDHDRYLLTWRPR